jgi:hypothetical protein
MIFSESIKSIAEALGSLQSELIQPKKNAINPFHKSRYVTLEGTVDAIKDLCKKHGLSYTQSIVSNQTGVGVQTMIMHESGEYIIHEPFYFPLQQQSPQGGASASTYARRYSLSAAFGIVPEDDDDGNFASQKPKEKVEF